MWALMSPGGLRLLTGAFFREMLPSACAMDTVPVVLKHAPAVPIILAHSESLSLPDHDCTSEEDQVHCPDPRSDLGPQVGVGESFMPLVQLL